jgi:hypothetical protein
LVCLEVGRKKGMVVSGNTHFTNEAIYCIFSVCDGEKFAFVVANAVEHRKVNYARG